MLHIGTVRSYITEMEKIQKRKFRAPSLQRKDEILEVFKTLRDMRKAYTILHGVEKEGRKKKYSNRSRTQSHPVKWNARRFRT